MAENHLKHRISDDGFNTLFASYQIKKILYSFLCLHFFIWVVLPLFRSSIPMDSLEALIWGSEWQFGTNKHPFLSGWLSEIFYKFIGIPDLSCYLLSQVCVLTGMYFIYRLSLYFVEPVKALLGTLFLEGTIYYTVCSTEYNVNVLSLALVPTLIYFFYKSMQTHKNIHWLLTGFLAGLVLITKYTNGLFLFCMGLYILLTENGRKELKRRGIYLAALTGFCVCLPHLIWLFQHNFYVLNYFTERAVPKKDYGIFNHLIFPIKFFAAQILAALTSLILFLFTYYKAGGFKKFKIQKPHIFLFYVGLLPLLILLLLSAVGGVALKSMWGYAFLSYPVLILFTVFPVKISKKTEKAAVYAAYIVLVLTALVYIITLCCTASLRMKFNGPAFAEEMKNYWTMHQSEPLKYVGGDIWFTSNVSMYAASHPRVLFLMDPQQVPWLDETDILKSGCLIIANKEYIYRSYQNRYPSITEPLVKINEARSLLFGKKRTETIYYGILPPQSGVINEK